MAKKIEDRLQKNEQLAALISQLKGIGGDKPTDVKSPSKPKKSKNKSTGAIMKEVGDLFEKGDDDLYANSTATAEDYLTNWGGSGFEVGGGY
jgi:hypothetical protein